MSVRARARSAGRIVDAVNRDRESAGVGNIPATRVWRLCTARSGAVPRPRRPARLGSLRARHRRARDRALRDQHLPPASRHVAQGDDRSAGGRVRHLVLRRHRPQVTRSSSGVLARGARRERRQRLAARGRAVVALSAYHDGADATLTSRGFDARSSARSRSPSAYERSVLGRWRSTSTIFQAHQQTYTATLPADPAVPRARVADLLREFGAPGRRRDRALTGGEEFSCCSWPRPPRRGRDGARRSQRIRDRLRPAELRDRRRGDLDHRELRSGRGPEDGCDSAPAAARRRRPPLYAAKPLPCAQPRLPRPVRWRRGVPATRGGGVSG